MQLGVDEVAYADHPLRLGVGQVTGFVRASQGDAKSVVTASVGAGRRSDP